MNTLTKIIRTSAAIFGVACMSTLTVGSAFAASPELDQLSNGDATKLSHHINDTLNNEGSVLIQRTGTAPATASSPYLAQVNLGHVYLERSDRRYLTIEANFENDTSRSMKVFAFRNTQLEGRLHARTQTPMYAVGSENPSYVAVNDNRINMRWDSVQEFHFMTSDGRQVLKADRISIQRNNNVFERETAARISDASCSGARISFSATAQGPEAHASLGDVEVVEATRCIWTKNESYDRETAALPTVKVGVDAIGSATTWEIARVLRSTDRMLKATDDLPESGDSTFVAIKGCSMMAAYGLGSASFGSEGQCSAEQGSAIVAVHDADDKGEKKSETQIIAMESCCK
jgi:predicted ribosome-associated RNA-binding protein Tma20